MNDITYFGTNEGAGGQKVSIRHSNGNVTHLKHRIVLHSPDGFQWGYGGSGPADLALNMLFDYLLRTKTKGARVMALDLHQAFKWGFIATQTRELCVTGKQIKEWLTGAQVLGKLTGSEMTEGQIKALTIARNKLMLKADRERSIN